MRYSRFIVYVPWSGLQIRSPRSLKPVPFQLSLKLYWLFISGEHYIGYSDFQRVNMKHCVPYPVECMFYSVSLQCNQASVFLVTFFHDNDVYLKSAYGLLCAGGSLWLGTCDSGASQGRGWGWGQQWLSVQIFQTSPWLMWCVPTRSLPQCLAITTSENNAVTQDDCWQTGLSDITPRILPLNLSPSYHPRPCWHIEWILI